MRTGAYIPAAHELTKLFEAAGYAVCGLAYSTRRIQQKQGHDMARKNNLARRSRVPRAGLVTALAAVLERRARRELAPQGLRPEPFEHHEREAARRMLVVADLAPLVPAPLIAEVRRERQAAEARARLEAERGRRRREREAEAAWERRYEAERERRRLRAAYSLLRRFAYLDYRAECERRGAPLPVGPRWSEQPEHAQLRADWPQDPPEGWTPPPGVLERVVEPWTTVPYGYDEEAEVRPLVPRYVPGRPWPWMDKDGHGAEPSRDGPPPTASCR